MQRKGAAVSCGEPRMRERARWKAREREEGVAAETGRGLCCNGRAEETVLD